MLWTFPPKPDLTPAAPPVEGTAPAEPPITVGEFSYSSPAIAGGVVYVGNLDGYVYAVTIADGKLKWRFKTEDGVTSSPLVEDGMVFIGSNDGNIYALNAETGAKVWTYKTGNWVNSSPRISDGVLYCGSNDKNMYALDAKTGALKGKFATEGPVVAIPTIHKNYVIVTGGQGDGTVSWSTAPRCRRSTSSRPPERSRPTVIDGDMMYVGSFDRQMYAFGSTSSDNGAGRKSGFTIPC